MLLLALPIVPSHRAADGPVAMPEALAAVAAGLEVERTLLKDDLEGWNGLAARREEVRLRLDAAHESLDAAMRPEAPGSSSELEALVGRVEAEARALAEVVAAERVVLDRVRERRRRIGLLEEKVAALQARAGEAVGPMTATWDISLLPGAQRGRLFLTQKGALVTGTYVLDGGYSGSVQGTLVNRKLVLERIDSRLGRWGKLEGFLSPDGTRLRGTWSRLELAGGEGGEGQWSAVRSGSQP
jgi:hypothetical protein